MSALPRRSRRVALAVALVVLGSSGSAASGSSDPVPAASAHAWDVSEREAFGLPTDEATMSLLEGDADVGSGPWGIPMTAAEGEAIDLVGRMTFANEVATSVVPYLDTTDINGGHFIDQAVGGRLVVLLTEKDDAIERELHSRMPSTNRGLEIRYVETEYPALEAAARAVWSLWPEVGDGIPLNHVSVDVVDNSVRLDVSEEYAYLMSGPVGRVQDSTGVPVTAGVQGPGAEVACTSRDNCFAPIKAGTRIRKSSGSGQICTMAFHVIIGNDEQFLTAGHCGYGAAFTWYQTGYGLLGSDQVTLYREDGIDAMRIGLPDSQRSNYFYGISGHTEAYRNPILGETLCASLGNNPQTAYDCGTVTDATTSWTGDACACTIYGADTSGINAVPGDSGSPMIALGPGTVAVAVGVLNLSTGHFAKMQALMGDLGGTVVYVPG